MANRFPDTPTFTGLNQPCRIEGEISDLEYDGVLPPVPARDVLSVRTGPAVPAAARG